MVAHKLVTPIPLPEPSAIRIPCTPAKAVEFCVGHHTGAGVVAGRLLGRVSTDTYWTKDSLR